MFDAKEIKNACVGWIRNWFFENGMVVMPSSASRAEQTHLLLQHYALKLLAKIEYMAF